MNILDRAEKFMVGMLANCFDEVVPEKLATEAFLIAEAFEAEAKKRGINTDDWDFLAKISPMPTGIPLTAEQWAVLQNENRRSPIKPASGAATVNRVFGVVKLGKDAPQPGPVAEAHYYLHSAVVTLEKSTDNAAPYAIAKINEAIDLLDPDQTYVPPTDHE